MQRKYAKKNEWDHHEFIYRYGMLNGRSLGAMCSQASIKFWIAVSYATDTILNSLSIEKVISVYSFEIIWIRCIPNYLWDQIPKPYARILHRVPALGLIEPGKT